MKIEIEIDVPEEYKEDVLYEIEKRITKYSVAGFPQSYFFRRKFPLVCKDRLCRGFDYKIKHLPD